MMMGIAMSTISLVGTFLSVTTMHFIRTMKDWFTWERCRTATAEGSNGDIDSVRTEIVPLRVGDTFVTDDGRCAEAIAYAADMDVTAVTMAVGALVTLMLRWQQHVMHGTWALYWWEPAGMKCLSSFSCSVG